METLGRLCKINVLIINIAAESSGIAVYHGFVALLSKQELGTA